MTGILALHGAGGSPTRFRDQIEHIASATPSNQWHFPTADTEPAPVDKIHYAGLGAAAYRHPCWDIDNLAKASQGKVLLGFSMGAITAMRLLQTAPEGVRALVCVAGCYSMMQMFGETYQAPVGFTGPVLFIHGNADKKIPPSLSEECAKELKRSGAPVEYWVIEGAGHDFGELGLSQPSKVANQVGQWIEEVT